MPDWVVTDRSNPMDKVVGYQSMLAAMRTFVRAGGVAQPIVLTIKHGVGAAPATTLTMKNDNFEVTSINGHQIAYNYAGGLEDFHASGFPNCFPTDGTAPTAAQKTQLLYMFPEAARSAVIEDAFVDALTNNASVKLSSFLPLVKAYQHTCGTGGVGLNHHHPPRALTAADYKLYAATLADRTPDRIHINALFG